MGKPPPGYVVILAMQARVPHTDSDLSMLRKKNPTPKQHTKPQPNPPQTHPNHERFPGGRSRRESLACGGSAPVFCRKEKKLDGLKQVLGSGQMKARVGGPGSFPDRRIRRSEKLIERNKRIGVKERQRGGRPSLPTSNSVELKFTFTSHHGGGKGRGR